MAWRDFDPMTPLKLTAGQVAAIEPQLRSGQVLLAKITREMFDGTNAATSGCLSIEFGSVPTVALPALREAIRKATTPAPAKKVKPSRATATGCNKQP